MSKKHARYRMYRCTEKNYRTCPYCGSNMVFVHYEKEPVRLKRYNGAAWDADCNCGGLFRTVKDDRGNWIIYDTQHKKSEPLAGEKIDIPSAPGYTHVTYDTGVDLDQVDDQDDQDDQGYDELGAYWDFD